MGFDGVIKEIPHIRVDNFNDLNSDAYFLSHCHTDHMSGLWCYSFHKMLVEKNVYLYASEVSCLILEKMYGDIRNNLIKLDMYSPTFIELRDRTISVMPLPAGHCPGSIMFLFETVKSGNILYTGDYRINPRDFRKLKALYDSLNQQKVIDKVYLDTTFFHKSFLTFPSRDDSLKALYDIINDWIGLDKKNIINLMTSARYGYEFLFLELYKKFKMPIHVHQGAFDKYKYFPELSDAVTVANSDTQLHCRCLSENNSLCRKTNCERNIKNIRISALSWKDTDFETGIAKVEKGIHKVCYSTHASFEEGSAFIKFLRPKRIQACVEQRLEKDNLEMCELIKEHLKEIHGTVIEEEIIMQCAENVTLFQLEEESSVSDLTEKQNESEEEFKMNKRKNCEASEDNTEESDISFLILDSPPRKQSKE